ncbi:MAG: fatty acid desaturase [Planctomycetota bacterium]
MAASIAYRPTVDRDVMRRCTQVSNWRSIATCFAIWALVVGLALVGGRLSGYWLALPAMLLISGLQHHLLIMMHDGAHGLIHRRRWVNELASDVFCAIPFLTLTRFYRAFHLAHHKHTGVRGLDPEVEMYESMSFRYEKRTPLRLTLMFLADLCFVNFVRYVGFLLRFTASRELKPGPRDVALNLAVWGPLAAAAIAFGFWQDVLLFWFVPYATFTVLIAKLHGYGEHNGAEGPSEYDRTWEHEFGVVANYFIYPLSSGQHLEHHLFPRVPWYHLPALKRELLQDEEHRRRAEPITVDGYFLGGRTILGAMLLEPRRPEAEVIRLEPRMPSELTSSAAA